MERTDRAPHVLPWADRTRPEVANLPGVLTFRRSDRAEIRRFC